MPRILRSSLGNVFLHNMVHGINNEYIFKKNMQKREYLKLIKKYSEKYKIIIIAYSIMENHAHILTYSQDSKNIGLFMKEVNSIYAIYYNKSKNRSGYVFRSRFYSKIIYDKEYLLKCIKYIHMNPVKANICKQEGDYEFSSYKEYLNKNQIINSPIYELVFNQNKNYQEIFESTKYEILNIRNTKIDLNGVLEKFLIQENLKLSQIQNDKILIKKFIGYLISEEYDFTKTELAKVLKISRAKLYRKLC